jgi:cation diffusion facilitator family transporter
VIDPLVRRQTALARTRRVVFVSVATQILETAALAAAAIVTGSSALVAQSFAAGSDIAVQLFLVLGVSLSVREPDEQHPLGYGRERYFWSLFGALAVSVSGFAVAIQEALRGAMHPVEVSDFGVGYAVLAVTLVFETVAFVYSWGEIRLRAREHRKSVGTYLSSTTEPAAATELIGNSIGLAGGVLATVALALTQATGSRWPDVIASALIGLALMAAAVALTQQNRSLLTGRGVGSRLIEAMRKVVLAHPGVVGVPELLGIVVGPSTFVVEGDVAFDAAVTVPELEAALLSLEAELMSTWSEVCYVFLTPVAPRRLASAQAVPPEASAETT